MLSFPPEPHWIAAAVETPLMAILVWMLHSLRRSIAQAPDGVPLQDLSQQKAALDRTRDELAAFKLEVARTYVPLSLIRDVDGRLTAHLIRIEQKLDEATRAAHSTAAQMRVLAEDR
ncbi:hypothetical protein J8J14_17910 [Roseomonas sp. SSH11]|uniref:DUF2730 family protein n=1 Tax=Pararoseomonas baculiformis TaxID=2820812 RepID=A0ABS4AI02_9PROT|nr:hypothetical protein [Pararoseomonas baculiformis]MBP0446654.1 hypothetical protein [Pararoseomonas baculiformis]